MIKSVVPQDPPGFSIVQGFSSRNSVALNILFSGAKEPIVTLYRSTDPERKPILVSLSRVKSEKTSRFKTLLLNYTDLAPNEEYTLKVISADGNFSDERTLTSLNTNLTRAKIAIVSCADDSASTSDQANIWNRISENKPDVIFAIGDNVYADFQKGIFLGQATPEKLWERYAETRLSVPLYRMKHLIPVYAIWDDHDYGTNDGGDAYLYREESKQIFQAFWPQPEESSLVERGPGLSFLWEAFGQRFVFLDGRSYRSPNRRPAICQKQPSHSMCSKEMPPAMSAEKETQLGWGQESWLSQIASRSAGFIWLIKGDQFFGAYHPFESYEGSHPHAFKRFVSTIRQSPAKFVFVSGDRHLSELMKIDSKQFGYETVEITSSPVHAKTYPPGWDIFPNPRQIAYASQTHNFVLVSASSTGRELELDIEAKNSEGKSLFKNNFKLGRNSSKRGVSTRTKRNPN